MNGSIFYPSHQVTINNNNNNNKQMTIGYSNI